MQQKQQKCTVSEKQTCTFISVRQISTIKKLGEQHSVLATEYNFYFLNFASLRFTQRRSDPFNKKTENAIAALGSRF